ncbi:ABC transporter ATP-binding protein [Paucilactobacillus hokkaidonensis JCM 18461]|uniref:ABC transporter ATP-binding protein n=2 Tax=Paucilactobacillus hokkaidonensis TaxID=1193095 RepID=A0A0A1GSX5_9LACO|nr:ATP-binding cassette domain-containing protein [Paucilactobacillus hokkaidonensis]KRO10092.1 ABC transporter ATPase [Paucilactobacillus hokkaidonensis]BAP85397.1 ABC transporter ATP-binding protein [Paucilactobacillus hokkaidonensis JCM 18461]
MTQIKIVQLEKVVAGQTLFTTASLTANGREIVGVIGNNGTGKTTLMRIIAGMDADFTGQRLIQGQVGLVAQVNPITDRSGGQETVTKIRTMLAQNPEILILDEPTANLDEEHQDWLVGQLRSFRGLILVISHDQHFLTQIATCIWAFENHTVTQFNGSLTAYEQLKTQTNLNQTHEYQRQHRQEHELKLAVQARKEKAAHIRRGSRQMGRVERAKTKSAREQNAGKMEHNAHALLMRAEKQAVVTKPFEQRAIKLMQTDFPIFKGKTVVSADHLDVKNVNKTLLQQVSFQIKPGERVALVGPNGIGKTSLIQAIISHAMHTNLSQHAKIGYFNQDITTLPLDQSVWGFIQRASGLDNERTKTILGAFGLSAPFYPRLIGSLSGGEQVKLQLLSILLGESNFLILDEPTNFLDTQALQALADYLHHYPGTVLLVSHDINFRQQVATRTLLFQNKHLIDPTKTTMHAQKPSELPLLQLKYDRLMATGEGSVQELQELKQQIEQLKQHAL